MSQFVLAGIALVFAAGATLAIPYAFKQMIDLGFGAAGTTGGIRNVNATFLALFGVATVLGLKSWRFTTAAHLMKLQRKSRPWLLFPSGTLRIERMDKSCVEFRCGINSGLASLIATTDWNCTNDTYRQTR